MPGPPFHPEAIFLPALLVVAAVTAVLVAATLESRTAYERRAGGRSGRLARLRGFVERLSRMEVMEGLETLRRAAGRMNLRDEAYLIGYLEEIEEEKRTAYLTFLSSRAGKLSLSWVAMHGRSRWQRARALELMSAMDMPRTMETLLDALDDRAADVRYIAAAELAKRPDEAGGRALADLVGSAAMNDRRLAVILASAKAPVSARLIERLEDESAHVRYWAAEVLGFHGGEAALGALERAARDKDAGVRSAAFRSIGRIGSAAGQKALAQGLRDEEWCVRAQAAKAAGALSAEQELEKLLDLLSDRNWWVRQNARLAIEQLGKKAHGRLIEHLTVADRFARNMVVEALESTGGVEDMVGDLGKGREAGMRAEGALVQFALAGGMGMIRTLAGEAAGEVREKLLGIIARARDAGEGVEV